MSIEKNNIVGAIGAVIGMTILILILLFVTLKTMVPEEEDGLMVVNIGNADSGFGAEEPNAPTEMSSPADAVTPPTPDVPAPAVNEAVETQTLEESIAMAEAKKKKQEEERRKAEELRKQQAEQEQKRLEEQRKQEEERKKQEAIAKQTASINNRAASAFGGGSGTSASQGVSGGNGNQGNPFGEAGSNNYGQGGNGTGTSGTGTSKGIEYSLGNRKIVGEACKPSYNSQEQGIVVVFITVDKNGNVIAANGPYKGSTTSDSYLIQAAKEAALKTKFDGITSGGNQYGTITYRFELR